MSNKILLKSVEILTLVINKIYKHELMEFCEHWKNYHKSPMWVLCNFYLCIDTLKMDQDCEINTYVKTLYSINHSIRAVSGDYRAVWSQEGLYLHDKLHPGSTRLLWP